jgi:hypothetical protein
VIVAGVRVATVISIGIATIAAAIDAGGLGVYVFQGLAMVDDTVILAGAVPAARLAAGVSAANRSRTATATVMIAIFTWGAGCSNRSTIVGPLPMVDGTWLVQRTVVSARSCGLLLDGLPAEFVFRTVGDALDVVLATPTDPQHAMTGFLESDGDFELQSAPEIPGFSREAATVRGRFARDALTAIQTSEVVYLDPEFIEIFGIERCESTIRWEGERA